MKYTLYTIGAALLLAGCSDFLDRTPQGREITDDFFSTGEGAIRATNAIYNHLRNYEVHTDPFIAVTSIASDDAEKGGRPGDGQFRQHYDDLTMDANEGLLNRFWNGYYGGVSRTNQVITRVPEIEMDEELKARLIAEAQFLRAYFYFNLVRTFGGVPLLTERPVDGVLEPQPRATAEETYALIRQDLEAAVDALPEKSEYPDPELGRATKGAAKGLLAKVSMYQQRWEDVLRLTGEVIASGEYDLSTPYEEIWREVGENSGESLFEVQCGWSSASGIAPGSQYSQIQGPNPLGWGFNSPTESLINAYEPGDPRVEATIMEPGQELSDGYIVPPDAPSPRYNLKAYVSLNETGGHNIYGNSSKNIRLLRYADIMLMHAEASNELGQSGQALESLNAVRARARGGDESILPDVMTTDPDELRQLIWHERRVELAMEHDRFYDLVRQEAVQPGRAVEAFEAHGKTWVKGKNEVFPIPLPQIDLTNGLLEQNPGY